MSIHLLEVGEMEHRTSFNDVPKSLLSLSPFAKTVAPSLLTFEWQTDDNDSDCVIWHGDIDSTLGVPQGAFPRTLSAWIEVLHPEDRDEVLSAIEAHLHSDEPYTIECRACHAHGHLLHWLHSGQTRRDKSGEPIAFIGSLLSLDTQSTSTKATGYYSSKAAPTDSDLAPSGEANHASTDVASTDVAAATTETEAPLELIQTEPVTLPREPYIEMVPQEEAAAEAISQTATEALVSPPTPLEDALLSPEQRVHEERVHEEQSRAESLLRAAKHLNAQLGLQEVCQAICEEAGRTLGAPSAVMLFNKERDAFVPTAVRGMPLNYDKRYIPTPRYVYEGHVAAMGTLFLFTDAQATPDLPNHKLYQQVNMRTIGIASLIRDGEVLGLLKVYSFIESRTFTANELALLQGLADIAAQAIANARLLDESQRRLANLGALREIDKAILGSSDVNIALSVVLEQVMSRLGADASNAFLLDPHSRTLRYAVGRGFRTNTLRHTEWQLGEGLAGRAALERRIVHVPDLSHPELLETQNPSASAHSQAASLRHMKGVPTDEGFASYYGVPLIAAGRVQGVLEVWHRSLYLLGDEDLEFLETLAGQAAIAVDNATLFRDLQRSNDELVLAYDSTLAGWSGALDLRDKETEGHSERVTHETVRLAREMGIGEAEIVHIRRGARLHDIGKVGVPDAILLKPGPLSDDEWDVMRKHPAHAFELLSPIEYLRPALDIPYAHHEKWDGSGYPRGLSGEQIPLQARLFAVVDVWDALCSDRPYRKGWPLKRVLNHIREGSGSHFDPAVVEAFLRLHADELQDPDPQSNPNKEEEVKTVLKAYSRPELKPVRHRPWLLNVLGSFWNSGDDTK